MYTCVYIQTSVMYTAGGGAGLSRSKNLVLVGLFLLVTIGLGSEMAAGPGEVIFLIGTWLQSTLGSLMK